MKLIRYLPSSLLILVILTICLRASFFFSVGWILLFISVPHPLSVSSLCQLLSCFLFSWYDQSLSIIWRRGNWGGGVDGVFLCLDRIYLIPPYWTNKKKWLPLPPPLSLAVNWQSLFYGSFLILCWRQLPPPPRSPWKLQGPPQNPPILSSHLILYATPTQSAEHGACYDNLVSGFIHS